MFCNYQDECRKVHCDGLSAVFHGKCVTFAKFPGNTEIGVSVTFIPTPSTHVNLTSPQVSQKNIQAIETMFKDKNKLQHCLILISRIDCFLGRSTSTIEYFRFNFQNILTEKCTYEYLLDQLRKNIGSQWHQEFEIDGISFQTIGRVNFFMFKNGKPSFGNDPNVVSKTIFYRKSRSQNNFVIIYAHMFYCPHFILSVSDYDAYLEKVYEESDNIKNETLTVKTNLRDGFYLVAASEIAVCVDTYFNFSNKANLGKESSSFIQVVASAFAIYCCIVIR